jgi:hypothetical protein
LSRLPPNLTDWIGLSVTVLAALWVGVRAATAQTPAAPQLLSPAERHELAASLARQEPYWQEFSERHFPGDRWSQDDDFFNLEHQAARSLAQSRGTSPGTVLLGIDELLRAAPRGRKVTASPCKPRPFYD